MKKIGRDWIEWDEQPNEKAARRRLHLSYRKMYQGIIAPAELKRMFKLARIDTVELPEKP